MLTATIAETIVGSVVAASLVATLGGLFALGWLARLPRALARVDAWSFAHPWESASIVAAASAFPIFLVFAIIPWLRPLPLLLALLVLGLWFWFLGWSMSAGPARKRHDRQMRGGTF